MLASTGGHTRITPDPLYAIEDGELVLHLFDGIGVAARRLGTGQTLYLHPDHLGSLAVVTGDAGAVAGTLRYDPFGAVLAEAGLGGQVPMGFTGGVPDPGSGLLYLIDNETQAAEHVAKGVATKVGGALASYGFQWAMTSVLRPVAVTLMVDSASGAWDLYGVKLLYAIGVVKSPDINR